MPYTNIKAVLLDAVKYPLAIEAKLPAGAPVISTMLTNAANQIPAIPDFPMEIPDLPAPPELPAMPPTAARAGLRPTVTAVEVRPVGPAVTQPARPKVRFLF